MKPMTLALSRCVVCGNKPEGLFPDPILTPQQVQFFKLPEDRMVTFSLCDRCAGECCGRRHPSGYAQVERLVKAIQAAIETYDYAGEAEQIKAEIKDMDAHLDSADKMMKMEAFGPALGIARKQISRLNDLGLPRPQRDRCLDLLTRAELALKDPGAYVSCSELVRVREQTFGATSPEVADALARLGAALMQRRSPKEAEQHLRRAMGITATPTIREVLVTCLKAQEKFDEAASLI